ncbi:MarC family protein [Alteromonas sp. a30]|uniref:MarC family protein n=1 Tax=Alteromonas sp. a30 TaxID=2730917 RepID=UPI00227EE438|nr:MarC family protein [Alteromonas sp. a30]MCY7293997.1 MarC family protein [Alteromonas sp. a30]
MLEQILFLVTSFYTMINPLGSVPLYISMTESFSPQLSKKVAIKASLTAFIALVLFGCLGEWIFEFFGISVSGLKVVGGILFFIMGYEMLRGKTVPKKQESETETEYGSDIAIAPLGIPLIAGPGGITMAILFYKEAADWVNKGEVILSIFIVSVLTALTFIYGRQLMSLLGNSGSKVMMRVMGLIVMLIAVEFFFAGITPYIHNIMAPYQH